MVDKMNPSSDSDTDEMDSFVWSIKHRNNKKKESLCKEKLNAEILTIHTDEPSLIMKYNKFEELKKKSDEIQRLSAKKLYLAEKRRNKKLVRKTLRDPFIKDLVERSKSSLDTRTELCEADETAEWNEVKPFLTVNSHMQGPISHGDRKPKTELECKIDDAIKEEDFEKAELLSDTLANKEFAAKIAKAYNAKRFHEEAEKQKSLIKDKNAKKIRWTFEAKERWQMKGNM